MDQISPLDAAPAPLPQTVWPVELPWEIEPAPVARKPRKASLVVATPMSPERLHWPMIALTLLTAVTLVFAARADDSAQVWEFPAPAEQVR